METKAHLQRQSDLIEDHILSSPITVIGAGAIGSFTCLQLAKMGFENIEVYDFDKVSVENMNCQFYRFSDIGKNKAKALRDLIFDFTKTTIIPFDCKFDETKELSGIVISAVDSMEARKLIWDKCKRSEVDFFIDPRMGALDAALYSVEIGNKEEERSYEGTIRLDSESVQERCTAKSTIFTANLLSGLVSKTVVDCLQGNPLKTAQWSIKYNELHCSGGGSNGGENANQ